MVSKPISMCGASVGPTAPINSVESTLLIQCQELLIKRNTYMENLFFKGVSRENGSNGVACRHSLLFQNGTCCTGEAYHFSGICSCKLVAILCGYSHHRLTMS